jgi:hypothetical protein
VILRCVQNMIWQRNGALIPMAIHPAKNIALSIVRSSGGFLMPDINCFEAPAKVAMPSTNIPRPKRIIPKLKSKIRELRAANIIKPTVMIIILFMNFCLFLSVLFSMAFTNTRPGSFRCLWPVLLIFPPHPTVLEYWHRLPGILPCQWKWKQVCARSSTRLPPRP